MAVINKLDNSSNIVYNGNTINSLPTETLLLVLPTIVKSVDKIVASIGDTLTYTVTVTNLGLTTISNIHFTDILPAGCEFITGSFKENGFQVTPKLADHKLTYTIPSIGALGVVTLTFQVTVVGGKL